jgi:hypothetical protein
LVSLEVDTMQNKVISSKSSYGGDSPGTAKPFASKGPAAGGFTRAKAAGRTTNHKSAPAPTHHDGGGDRMRTDRKPSPSRKPMASPPAKGRTAAATGGPAIPLPKHR